MSKREKTSYKKQKKDEGQKHTNNLYSAKINTVSRVVRPQYPHNFSKLIFHVSINRTIRTSKKAHQNKNTTNITTLDSHQQHHIELSVKCVQ